MSRKIDHFIKELVNDHMVTFDKMKKVELKETVKFLLESNYRELHDDTIVELYEEVFHTVVL